MTIPVSFLSRRHLLFRNRARHFHRPYIVPDKNISKISNHAVILSNLYEDFMKHKNIHTMTPDEKTYAVKLLQAYELAVSQIQDIDMKELLESMVVNPLYVKNDKFNIV